VGRTLIRQVAALCCALFATVSVRAEEILVFAAASLTDALVEIVSTGGSNSGPQIIFSFGASSLMARQIEQGAPADIFISADEEKMDQLETKGLLRKGTRKSILSNSLVVVLNKESTNELKSVPELVALKRVAIAEPSTVPSGIYARKYLTRQKVWERLEPKILPSENVRAALAAVESGNVEAAMVYKTDANISKKVRVALEIPATETKISYVIAGVTRERNENAKGIQQTLEFLQSQRAQKIFQKHGFTLIPK
jgi:molybdate transport system substrate-binding protein